LLTQQDFLDLFERYGEQSTTTLYRHFSALRNKKIQARVRQHLSRLTAKGLITRTTAGVYKLSNSINIQQARWVTADEITFFDSEEPIRAHGLKIERKRPGNNIYDQVVTEGWEVNEKGNYAQLIVDYSDQCSLRFQVFTNGTVQIHTKFKNNIDKGFVYPEYQQFIDYLQKWGEKYGFNFREDFHLCSWDLNQDRHVIYDGDEKNIQVFQGVFLRVYQPKGSMNRSRWENKGKTNYEANLTVDHINESLRMNNDIIPAITTNEVSKVLHRDYNRIHYANLIKEINEQNKKSLEWQKTSADISFQASKKITLLKDELVRLNKINKQLVESSVAIIKHQDDAEKQNARQLTDIAEVIEAMTESYKNFSEKLMNIGSDINQAIPQDINVNSRESRNLTANDPYITSYQGFDYIEHSSLNFFQTEDLSRQPVEQRDKKSHVVSKSIPGIMKTAVHVTKQQKRLLYTLKCAKQPLGRDTIRKLSRIRKNSIRFQLQRLVDANVLILLPDRKYKLNEEVTIW